MVLGCRKCVPLNVERKLYRETLFVRFAISIDAVIRLGPSRCNKLSVPIATLWKSDQLRCDLAHCAVRVRATRERIGNRRKDTVARQAERNLLVGSQTQCGSRIGHAADHESAIKTLCQNDPLSVVRPLVSQTQRGLERLVVIDPEHTAGQRRPLRDKAARFRWVVSCAVVTESVIGLESVNIRGAQTTRDSVQ